MTVLSKQLRILSAGLLLVLSAGVSTQADAGPFQVTPSGDGLSTIAGSFTADAMNGNSSTLIQALGGNVYQSSGYIQFTGFSNQSQAVSDFVSGVNGDYGLYATFTQTFLCTQQLGVNVSCQGGLVSLSLWANPNNTDSNKFEAASVVLKPDGTALSVTAPTHDEVDTTNDILLGTVSHAISGTGGINDQGGGFENLTTDFHLTAAGANFFTSPVPFYNVSFNEFNNTAAGLSCNKDDSACAINFESGATDFTFNVVPEPTSVLLFALGLLALTTLRRKLPR